MKNLSRNLKFLREKSGLTQSQISVQLGFNRSTWNNYETGVSKPGLDDFMRISKYFGTTASQILEYDLQDQGNLISKVGDPENSQKSNLISKPKGNLKDKKYSPEGPLTVAQEPQKERVILAKMPQIVTVDSAGNENVIMVPVRARAGYLNGYSDPEFITTLPAYRLPGLNHGSFRLFEVEGLSMYPTLHSGDMVIGQNVEQLRDVRDDRLYVVVTKNEGVVVKRVLNRIEKDGKLILKSDNYKDRDMYPPIVADPADILEIWYATGFISRQMRPPAEMYNRLIDMEGRITILEAQKLK